jgi:di/tricarboxylate transporter
MTFEQAYVFAVLAATLGLFIWGRFRHDVVALMALLAVVAAGVVPAETAFEGFGHPAVITVAAVLVISRALQSSGMVGWVTRWLDGIEAGPHLQVALVSGLVAVLSSFMNNVGALALLLPVVMQAAKRYDRAPGELLMPLAFGSMLGGLITLIGTPPNIIVAEFRAEAAGAPFSMFDFAPVGLAVAAAGTLFMAFHGWRLIPTRETKGGDADIFDVENYITEVLVPRKSGLSGTPIGDVLAAAPEGEAAVAAIIRGKLKIGRPKPSEPLRINDHVLLEGGTEAIEAILHKTPLTLVGNRNLDPSLYESADVGVMEAVVTPASSLVRRSIAQAGLERRHGLHLLAMARQGRPLREHLRRVQVRPGDVLLLQGDLEAMPETLSGLGCLPLEHRHIALHRDPTPVPLMIFAVAIALGVFGVLSIPVAFTGAVVALVLSGQMRARELYRGVDWPVVVLLGAMVPLGMAMKESGADQLLAGAIGGMAEFLPAWGILALLLITAMLLSAVINNAATAILMAQLSVEVAAKIGVNPDSLLMAVAVGSSCAFLTPIGHQSNILVMGPGGYKFGDYWRLGLPLEILVVIVAVPMILWVWPL